MKKDLKFYLNLFVSMFYISAFTFGGGFVIIPLMKKKFVDEYQWIEEDEMFDLVAIAQASPGAIAVNGAIIIGYRLAGILGTLIAVLGTVLPPLIILSAISIIYEIFIQNIMVGYILKGMQAGVAAVIIDVVISMGLPVVKNKKILPIITMLGAFIATFIFKINVLVIIMVSAVLGSLGMVFQKRKIKSQANKDD